jgi:hypothetical protein
VHTHDSPPVIIGNKEKFYYNKQLISTRGLENGPKMEAGQSEYFRRNKKDLKLRRTKTPDFPSRTMLAFFAAEVRSLTLVGGNFHSLRRVPSPDHALPI